MFGSVADSAALLASLDPLGSGQKGPAAQPLLANHNGHAAAAPAAEIHAAGRTARVKDAKPYVYDFPVERTALLMIDFQRDFFLPGGFGDALGNDISLLQVSFRLCALFLFGRLNLAV